MSEITLINPPSPFLHDPLVMPPLGLCYISASLKKQRVEVEFVDFAKTQLTTMPKTNFYAISCTTPQFHFAHFQVKWLKENYPDSKVCVGGPHVTVKAEDFETAPIDAIIIGEGERAILEFMNGKTGIIVSPYEPNLDNIPFPDRSLIKDYDYRIDGLRATTMITSRGCPYRCAFCCKTWGRPRYRSAENVIEEAKELRDMGYEAIQFYDDELLIQRKRDFKIFKGLHDLDLPFRCFTRADLVNADAARFMADHGCREVLLGVESGSDAILMNINKGVTAQQNEDAIKCLARSGIRVKAAIIVGLPSESVATGFETWKFCKRVEPYVSDWDFTVCVPYPGSAIYEEPEKYDIVFNEEDVYTAYKGGEWKSIVATKAMSRDMVTALRSTLHRRYKGEIF